MTEDTTVTVWTEDALVASDIGKVSHHRVQRVVLLLHIVQVACVSLDVVAAEDSLEQQERIEIFVFPRGGIIKDTDIRVNHLVISDEEQCRNINGLFFVGLWLVSSPRKCVEMLLGQVNKLLMIDSASADDDNVLAKVVSFMKINYHVALYFIDIIDITKDRLPHHVLSENIIVHVLHECFHVIVIGSLKLLPDSILLHLKVIVIIV